MKTTGIFFFARFLDVSLKISDKTDFYSLFAMKKRARVFQIVRFSSEFSAPLKTVSIDLSKTKSDIFNLLTSFFSCGVGSLGKS